jgi:hypothetical protein
MDSSPKPWHEQLRWLVQDDLNHYFRRCMHMMVTVAAATSMAREVERASAGPAAVGGVRTAESADHHPDGGYGI